jgi:hypothetical protein
MWKVTFDSNVWEKLVDPAKLTALDHAEVYAGVLARIVDKKIEPFISETIFTLEAVTSKQRKSFIKEYAEVTKPSVLVDEKDGRIHIQIAFGPNSHKHPGNHPILDSCLEKALRLGFNIVAYPRIAGIVNADIEHLLYNISLSAEDLNRFLERLDSVSQKILDMKAGEYDIQQIGLKYDPTSWFQGVGLAPDNENERIALAVAEWADGDSVAAHISLQADYYCTNDKGGKAGKKSIMSKNNVAILEREYGFNKVSPSELLEIVA